MSGIEALVPLVFIISMAIVFVAFVATRNRERMAMIEKGLTSDEIKAMS